MDQAPTPIISPSASHRLREPASSGRPRLASIDQFRGLAIVLMVLANFMGGVTRIPAWLKHAPDIGLTLIDLIAPFFIFAIGLTYGHSFRRRIVKDGGWQTARHFILRFAILIAIGLVFSAGENFFGVDTRWVLWGVLAAIGFAGLVTLPALLLGTWARLALGLGILTVYQVLLDRFWLSAVLGAPHGGPLGAIAWSALLILATALADLFHGPSRRRWFPLAGALALALGLALALVVPVSKNRVSASYVLVSLGASVLLFFLFYLVNDRLRWHAPLLAAWGRNPLALYLLHQLLLGAFVLPGIAAWYTAAPLWLTALQAAALLAALSGIAVFFARRGWILSL
jgi:predicted acyltransferase